MNPITRFSERGHIPVGGFSLERQATYNGDTGPMDADLRHGDLAAKWPSAPSSCPRAKYPPIERDKPETWPIAWRGIWKGD